MGQATRTTKLLVDLGKRAAGGANSEKRAALAATIALLTAARAFYIDFFLAHPQKQAERVPSYSEEHKQMRERAISAQELLSWAEACTVETEAHPHPWAGWNFSERFPTMPFLYRRSVIKDCIGKARGYLTSQATQAGLPERRKASRARPPRAIIPPSTKVPARSSSRV